MMRRYPTFLDARALQLIEQLQLAPHPEGGYYRQIYQSVLNVQPADGRPVRPSLTTIYFLLAAGDVSRWHRVASDEVWHYYEGDALELFDADGDLVEITRHVLGRADDRRDPVHVIAAGRWQAARSTGAYTLVGCTVGPGFDFADFEMLDQRPDEAESFRRRHPDLAVFV
jgi:predicted cupin superfamily sugar epimerase